MFLKRSYDNTIEHFHDSLNILMILIRGRELFSAKCGKFIVTFME